MKIIVVHLFNVSNSDGFRNKMQKVITPGKLNLSTPKSQFDTSCLEGVHINQSCQLSILKYEHIPSKLF
jgi:hypothetical protein